MHFLGLHFKQLTFSRKKYIIFLEKGNDFMNNYNKILNFMKKNNGYITNKEATKINSNKTFLYNLVKQNKIEKVGVGIYKLPEYPLDNFYILSKSSKNMCYSYSTSLYLQNLSTRIPLIYDITVPYNYSGNLLKDENISLRYTNKSIFTLGMIDVKTINGFLVPCYDIERTLCDMIKDKKNMDKEIYAAALKAYAQSKNKDILKLIEYAKKLNIEKEVVEIMEVLL